MGILMRENPSSSYDGRFSLPDWYALTQESTATGNEIVEVRVLGEPEHDSDLYYPVQKTTPTLENGEWVLGWNLIEQPADSDE